MPKEHDFTSFDEVIRYHLEEEDLKRAGTFDNNWWFASEMGMCRRKQVMRRAEFPNSDEKQFRIKMIGRDGSAMHEWREDGARKTGALIDSEGKIRDEESRFAGRFDILVRLNRKPVIVDIKSQRPEAFFRRVAKPLDQKVEHHQKMQITAYVHFLRKLKGWWKKIYDEETKQLKEVWVDFLEADELSEGRIYYVDRAGGLREEYAFLFDERNYREVTEELETLNGHWAEKRLPKKCKANWECKYCPYAKICLAIEKNKIINIKDAQQLCQPTPTLQQTLI